MVANKNINEEESHNVDIGLDLERIKQGLY
jgi:hypothetical protein